jgi:hypothetical protein
MADMAPDRSELRLRPLLCCALAFASGILNPCRGATESPAASASTIAEPGTLIHRGAALHDAIIGTYRRLRAAHALPASIRDRRDLRMVVANYLPAGGSLYQTEIVLRAAGCSLYRGANGHVFSTLQLGSVLNTKYTFAVELAPAAGNESAAQLVDAALYLTYVPNVH